MNKILNQNYYKTGLKIALLAIFMAVFFAAFINNAQAAFGLDKSVTQVKTADSPAVYYLDHNRGMKKAYINANAFLSYGHKWSDIKIISQSELSQWLDIEIVKTSASPAVYYINGAKKALIINPKEFSKYGFQWGDVLTISAADLASYSLARLEEIYGGDVSGVKTDIKTADTGESGEIFARLDESNPSGLFLPLNTEDNLLAIFNFKANQAAKINNFTIKLNGVFKAEGIKRIYLKDMEKLGEEQEGLVNGRTVTFNLFSNSLIIDGEKEKRIGIYADLGYYDNILNHALLVSMENENSINADAKIIGNFPLKANVMKLIDGAGIIGKVSAVQETLNIKEAIVGNTGQRLAKYKISETTGREDIVISKIILKNAGAALAPAVNNFQLKNKNNKIIAQVSALAGREIRFKLNNYKIKKGRFDYVTVYADIIGDEEKTIELELSEVKARSYEHGFNLSVAISASPEELIIKREMLGVVARALKPNAKVFKQQSGDIVGLFEIRNDNQSIVLEKIDIKMVKSAAAPSLTNTVYLVNYNTGEIITSINGRSLDSGLITLNLGMINLGSKDKIVLALVAEMPEDIGNRATYKIILNRIVYKADNNRRYSDIVNVSGAVLDIGKSKLYIYSNKKESGAGFVGGQKKAKIASFILEASAGDDARLNSITFTKGDTSGSVSYDNGFSNMRAYIGYKRIGRIKRPYDNNFTFKNFSYTLKAGRRVEVKIYADLDKDIKVSETRLMVADLEARGRKSGVKTNIFGLNTDSQKVVFNQALVEISSMAGGNVAVGENNNLVSVFKIKNKKNADLRLRYLTLATSRDGFSYSLGYKNLRVVRRENARRVGWKISRPVAGANRISLRNYKIKPGEEVVFDVYVDAGVDAPKEDFEIYFSDLEAYANKIKADVLGEPTEAVKVIVG